MEEAHMGVWGALRAVVRSASAGFILAELVLASASAPIGPLPAIVAQVTGKVGVAGLGAVTLCLAFAAALVSLATGLLVGGRVMRLLGGAAGAGPAEVAAGIAVVTGAVANGTLAGLLPGWMYFLLQSIMVLAAYPFPRANEMTAVLSVIFIFLFLSVLIGSLGVFFGLVAMGISMATVCAVLKALSERRTQETRDRSKHWSERLLLYSVVVAAMGFSIGQGSGVESGSGVGPRSGLMLRSVLWVGLLSAALLGGALGTVVVVGLEPAGAERVALGAVLASSATLRLVLPACTAGGVGGLLGGATAAGVLLGAAGVASETEFKTRKTTLLVLASVTAGVVLGSLGLSPGLSPGLSLSELTAVTLVALGAFILGAPRSPFHTQVKLRGDILTGPALMEGVGMEAVSAAASPLGVGALGAAALGTAAMGRLGAMGVLGAAGLALGKTLEAAAQGR
ncbi:uncharacterized protein LOC134025151 [Osmerus eperlanus]|uniref:uncharacterized protein LOC134025151 n=1 Tax=Osmerus eperlanus TaxID=29151 RepID=UPI002E0D1D97